MNKSDEIDKLAGALSKLQGEVTDVQRDKVARGEKFNYSYADLSSVLEVARPLLCKHGLAVSQLCFSSEVNGGGISVGVETVLMHESGQWISSNMQMPVSVTRGALAQAIGSVISYLRRYTLSACLGIAQTDNDGVQEEWASNKKAHDNYHELLNKIYTFNIGTEIQKKWLSYFKVNSLEELSPMQIDQILEKVNSQTNKETENV